MGKNPILIRVNQTTLCYDNLPFSVLNNLIKISYFQHLLHNAQRKFDVRLVINLPISDVNFVHITLTSKNTIFQ